ncbi:hypothetical protein EIP91_005018 [Steccherinum ochraceum]|uniref:Uncharacterized protein n=1 Tax=Steccherinum ochraceum TaxID=92696 RepID=A0A4V2MXG4_9APHY|nr:hypothetical protein EIP91_005018 [Steccherinum ochraceum]
MLKRQRPSSPISFPDEDTMGAADLYEPDNKRRRYFAPHSYSTHQKREVTHMYDSDSEDGDGAETGRREYFAGKREWQVAAGTYKDANSLLHDLHAEQRHRALFTTPFPHTAPSSSSAAHTQHASTASQLRTSAQSAGDHSSSSFGVARNPPSVFDDGLNGGNSGYVGGERYEEAEAEVVTQHYETSNRFVALVFNCLTPTFLIHLYLVFSRLLRALFLSRRREIDNQDQA